LIKSFSKFILTVHSIRNHLPRPVCLL
jgi:hypothetical protein